MSASNMKWIQSAYFATGDPETEEMTTLYAPGMLGCATQFDRGGISGPQNICTYQLVKLATGRSSLVGNVMTWSDKGAWTVTENALNGNLAGIARIASANSGSYIWIVKKGDRPVLFVAAPAVAPSAAGRPVVPSDATAGKADCLALSQTQAAFPLIGTSLGATAADLASVRINIPDSF